MLTITQLDTAQETVYIRHKTNNHETEDELGHEAKETSRMGELGTKRGEGAGATFQSCGARTTPALALEPLAPHTAPGQTVCQRDFASDREVVR